MKIKININLIFFVTAIVVFSACHQAPKWTYERTIELDGITPLGIIKNGDFLWISDSDTLTPRTV